MLGDPFPAYPNAHESVLRDISLVMGRGGPSPASAFRGAGKLRSAMARLRDPTLGRIELDRRRDVRHRRSFVAFLLASSEQDVFLFDGSVREHRLPGAPVTDAQISAAARAANAESSSPDSKGLPHAHRRAACALGRAEAAASRSPACILADRGSLILDGRPQQPRHPQRTVDPAVASGDCS